MATVGRPGPVSLHVFQDVWDQEIEVPGWPDSTGYVITNDFRPSDDAIERAASLIDRAERPVIVAGNGVNLGRAQARLVELAERLNTCVVTTVTGKGAFPENHRSRLASSDGSAPRPPTPRRWAQISCWR